MLADAASALPDYLLRQRWYPRKDAGRAHVELSNMVPFPVPRLSAAIAVWRTTPPGEGSIHLFVPLALVPAEEADPRHTILSSLSVEEASRAMALVEAFSSDAFVRSWVAALLQGCDHGTLHVARTDQLKAVKLKKPDEWTMCRGTAEQSNTSIRIGEEAILKVIRKLEQGVHPELEIGRFLTEEAHFGATPALLGWTELHDSSSGRTFTLSLLQQFMPNDGDGWSWVLERLSQFGSEHDTVFCEVLGWVRQLGTRTAEMHRAFMTETEDPAFRPERVQAADLRSWTEAARAMSNQVLDTLTALREQLDPAVGELAASVLEHRGALVDPLNELMRCVPHIVKTRHHGDYHLGQVLVAGRDAIIVDFEGEPLRPLAERRAKNSVLRDVAGMLRSIAYVVAAAARSLPEHFGAPQRERAEQRLASAEAEISQAFVNSYLSEMKEAPYFPADWTEAKRLVRCFMLEKALYEIAYELAHRPNWVEIPLRGVLALIEKGPTSPRRMHRMPFGSELQAETVRFRLWAPSHSEIGLEIDGAEPVSMERIGQGWHQLVTDRARSGSRYRFVLPDGLRVPDPASRYQPDDVHGPSEVVDPSFYAWGDAVWRGRAWESAVVYELHIGAFTPEGTFREAIAKLDYLVALGVTAIEIMTVGDFPGQRNWGYDGVLTFAPDGSYGRPEDFKALVDAAHARGLMVLLDVVYNHFGPEGAYLHTVAPETFTDRHKTPWGAAINTDGTQAAPVREFFIHNALYWIEEFHLDGLRLDAVHAIFDDGPKHILEELAERVRKAAPDRPIHLILENEENQASWLARNADGNPRWYTAQWNDDVHHVLHVAASGEPNGYYADYKGDSERLGRALAEGYAFQGELMPYRGRPRGQPSRELPPGAFVAFIQNHDQIGNRAFGDRLTAFATPDAVRAIAAVYLLLPQVPMLFMGEEWAAQEPFPFFCDFGPELADAVRKGRREEFARFPEFQDPKMRERIPDPMAEETFASAKLGWHDIEREPHKGWLDWYRRVLAMRHAEIVPLLAGIRAGGRYDVIGDTAVVVRWDLGQCNRELVLAANLSSAPVAGFPPAAGRVLWREGDASNDGEFGAWTVRWSLENQCTEAEGETSELDRLAEQMGIEPEFRDAHGKTVRASVETKRRLLAAMGVEVDDEAQVRRALENLDRSEWLSLLPPVIVSRVDVAPPAVDLTLPADTKEVSWRVKLEDGSERSGRVDFGTLDAIGESSFDGRKFERRRLELQDDLPWGYHQLKLEPGSAAAMLVITPGRCWLPPVLIQGRRLWGIAAQLYLLRSATDWGIGDFGDLRSLIELAASRTADVIGLNPLHALFIDDPEHASPYSPASRLLLNVLNIDVMAVPELVASPEARELIASEHFRHDLETCRKQRLVDYSGITKLKLKVLSLLFERCRGSSDQTRWQDFETFRHQCGEVLERNCLFLALREHFAGREGAEADWHTWPGEYRDPTSPGVRRFADENRRQLEFLGWLQWIADDQLGAAAATAAERGMAVGLYRDLAVGADRGGAETWVNAAAVLSGAHVGAPPDIYNPAGQDWGLPPFNPRALKEECYRSFVQLVRANMRHAGGLRIDHVMGLQHLYWVPEGEKPEAGAYVRYPIEDLIGILALESHRQHCLVVGEDLGTVPEGFRERMAEANILSYRVLFFEQDPETGNFVPPDAYPTLALAVVGSHDLPTLRGWWEGRDLDLKEQLGLYPKLSDAAEQRDARQQQREQLLRALRREGLLVAHGDPDISALVRATHAFLARSSSMLAMAQIDDLTDELEPVNVPATSDEHPNWRRRLSMTLEELAERPLFADIAELFRNERAAGGRA